MGTSAHRLVVTAIFEIEAGEPVSVPAYLCSVPAGFPSPAGDYVEREIDLNDWLITNRLATYIVRVEGDSMAGEIHSGDRLIVDRSLEPRHGDVVVACINGEMTIKRLMAEGGRFLLVADNPAYPPIEVDGEQELLIWGVVTNSIHRLR
ncbi:MAG: LexA family protein, partial [Pyrinomonadaceae bacterium]